ncbi:hypothetical protein DdX_22156 [Ditylenchus destructor]|uniref:Saposin B-type domain-containing protein n=1 Tax=Ditylenchus destructor TaxID=166010 RepID=A0AAD4MF97_9BILA|nr:hypothetical protein DdX_22156 [Ditylenchus destructor]
MFYNPYFAIFATLLITGTCPAKYAERTVDKTPIEYAQINSENGETKEPRDCYDCDVEQQPIKTTQESSTPACDSCIKITELTSQLKIPSNITPEKLSKAVQRSCRGTLSMFGEFVDDSDVAEFCDAVRGNEMVYAQSYVNVGASYPRQVCQQTGIC